MEKSSQFSFNCTNLTESDMLSINLAFSVTSIVCVLVSLLIVLILIFYKAFESLLHQLFLYLMVTTTLREVFLAASIEHQFQYKGQDEFCTWIAFGFNWFWTIIYIFTVGIITYLLYLVFCVARGKAPVLPNFLQSKHQKIILECSYVFLPTMFSFVYAWIPYINNNYGLAGSWCWIAAQDESCNLTIPGLLDQLLMVCFFSLVVAIIGAVVASAFIVIHYKVPDKLHEARRLLKKTAIMLMCLLVNIVITISALSIRIHSNRVGEQQPLAMWFILGISCPISVLPFPFAYLMCFYTTRIKSIKSAALEWKWCCFCCPACRCTSCEQLNKFHIMQQRSAVTLVPTIPESTRVSPPSNTFFEVSYTNNFTHITTENEPLTSNTHTDTGYDSISQH